MSKYTMSLEDYVLSRHFARMLADDASTEWPAVMIAIDEDPSIAYKIIKDEVLPDLSIYLYTSDEAKISEFIAGFVDKFYFCEIGQETMARFKWTLRAYFRNSAEYWRQLYAAQLASFAESLKTTDYKRTLHDALTRTGTDTTDLTHGAVTTVTPGRVQKNKIIPLGGSAEKELNESSESGTEVSSDTGTDTTELTHDTLDDRWIVEELDGYQGADKAAILEKYRSLILDINTLIYDDIAKHHLFMEVW